MARQANTLPAVHAIDLPEEYLKFESPPTGRVKENPSLPVYRKGRCNCFKNCISRPRLHGILSHLIPVVVVLCFFILWWFSHAVSLENENGKLPVVGEEDYTMAEPVNVTLTSTTSTPYPLVPYARDLKKSSRAGRAVSTSTDHE